MSAPYQSSTLPASAAFCARAVSKRAALKEGDPTLIAAALGDTARAKGMSQIARDTGLGRESLYKAPSPEGNPEFGTIMKVVTALRLQLHASPARATGYAIVFK